MSKCRGGREGPYTMKASVAVEESMTTPAKLTVNDVSSNSSTPSSWDAGDLLSDVKLDPVTNWSPVRWVWLRSSWSSLLMASKRLRRHYISDNSGSSSLVTYFLAGVLLKVASTVQNKCLALHREHGSGNFSLESHRNLLISSPLSHIEYRSSYLCLLTLCTRLYGPWG